MWNCICDCGKEHIADGASMKNGTTQSCGCLHDEMFESTRTKYRYKHGEANQNRLYRIWKGMKGRCYVKTNTAYKNYGAKGVTICDEWKNNYSSFKDWALANGYEDGLTIDRIDPFGNYEPSNCRWSTYLEQAHNKRRDH